MNYQETLNYLYNSLPMFQRQGAPAMKKDLSNIKAFCSYLGEPQNSFPSIHVAGTNGKGSTTHMLSALFQSQGYKVGLYTSPHYRDFRERIKINNKLIPKNKVVQFVHDHKEKIEAIKPSFFEITVAMAFDYFASQQPDICIIEVGLGGRLDSTNIIHPEVSVITNISMDHMQFLGNTLKAIAGEKAGIIKKGVPVIISEKQEEVQSVFENKANENGSVVFYAEDQWKVNSENHTVQVHSKDVNFSFEAAWFSDYQEANLQGALCTFYQYMRLNNRKINWVHVTHYLSDLPQKTHFLGRWSILGESPKIIADSGHNEAGIKRIFEQLRNEKFNQLHIVLGFSDDKDLNKALPLFPKEAKYYFAKADIPRGMNAKLLKEQAKENGLNGRSYVSVKSALSAAKRSAAADDLIFIGGSIFVVAEVV